MAESIRTEYSDYRVRTVGVHMRYLVVYFDTNGRGRLVGEPNEFETETEARSRIEEIEQVHTKPHKVDYEIISYEPEEKYKVLKEKNIVW